MRKLLLALLGTLQAGIGQQPQPQRILTVCDVLADDPTRLNGKIIRVKGVLEETPEGTWLVADCKTHLVTKGLTWANVLWVSVGTDLEAVRSWDKFGEKLGRLRYKPERDRIWLTINGMLETRASMDDQVVQMPYGLHRAGFGHMGDAPAEIRVISVEDVSVEHRSAEKPAQ
jgi:hypothetical protein